MGTIERLCQAVLFEVLAVTLSIIGLVMFTNHDVNELSEMMIVVATVAMVWNYFFNRVFDCFATGRKETRSFALRIVHVLLFEAGLLFFTVPVMAYILSVSLWQAFMMDLGVTIFITIYAFMFNLIYDHARVFILQHREVTA